ncbi:hypothetical protein EIL87_02080 [Saccharopolyspora rhizosphaerae]|uniref:DUF7144 domain-containing protein n=1 Tax=Saccharopolyspora rhizosphaerae TaxID=2492662 RepID=A0A3R8Q891_9PSEU|nr:hypothetical protein [Saccharopolyspora rhizosphaerae]RRO20675.1 hypothetical protein EIL87_02080 [Saccharopolyspora rhizosphaerae]
MATHGARPARTGWVGWIYFGAVVLVAGGIVQFVNGLIALADSGMMYLLPSGMAVQVSFASVGISFMIMGIVLAAAGIGVMSGKTWARVLAITLAVLSVLGNIAFFTAYPIWSAIVIVLDVLVIYALVAHGKELRHS